MFSLYRSVTRFDIKQNGHNLTHTAYFMSALSCPAMNVESDCFQLGYVNRSINQSINQSINTSICIAPNRQKSSEVLAAKQMSFELFCKCVNGKRRSAQFDRESVLCRWPGHREVTPADVGPCTWHNECAAVRRPQLPPADDYVTASQARFLKS